MHKQHLSPSASAAIDPHPNWQGTAKRVLEVCSLAAAACGLLLMLPLLQGFLISLLSALKGGQLRRPELWLGRMRETALLLCTAGLFFTALSRVKNERREQLLYLSCLVLAFIPWTLFPLGIRSSFLQYFKGLSPEQAADFKRLDALLYKALFCSAAFFTLAFLIKNYSFSMRTLVRDRQCHTIVFSAVLIISFASFYLGIPDWIERRGTLWFYTIFDYNDFTLSIRHRGVNGSYPPLANLITGLFKAFTYSASSQAVISPGEGGYSILSPLGSFLLFLFFLTHLLPLLLICHRAIDGNNFTKLLFALAICTSSFVVYAVMRGNIILLAVICSLYYMVFYEAKDRRLRQTALFALALAANIKVYPAIFGCLLLKKKRWKDIGLCILYSALLFFPLFFTYDAGFSRSFSHFMRCLNYAGSDKISAPGKDSPEIAEATAQLSAEETATMETTSQEVARAQEKKGDGSVLQALSSSTFGIFSISTAVSAFTKTLQAPRKLYSLLLAASYLLYLGLSILLFIKAKRAWCLFLVPATACYLIPGMTYVYVPIFLLLPLIALLNEQDKRPSEYIAMLILLLMFACNWTTWPYVLGYKDFPSLIFTIGLYVAAFLTLRPDKKSPAEQGFRTN